MPQASPLSRGPFRVTRRCHTWYGRVMALASPDSVLVAPAGRVRRTKAPVGIRFEADLIRDMRVVSRGLGHTPSSYVRFVVARAVAADLALLGTSPPSTPMRGRSERRTPPATAPSSTGPTIVGPPRPQPTFVPVAKPARSDAPSAVPVAKPARSDAPSAAPVAKPARSSVGPARRA